LARCAQLVDIGGEADGGGVAQECEVGSAKEPNGTLSKMDDRLVDQIALHSRHQTLRRNSLIDTIILHV
jgi:hypothetical protein